ncbi:signal transduction histidine kinase [Paenibacillus castaneae]|uniref:sensor histidine kinase n=1 Tax=Paenibacillus castaneae TaxID=474957 RepID=UPI000C9B1FE5|nr:HAMP domain-containing sensor histidine kinase [Paenibacillus castaneae]NIK79550.1 signal transduction histidine kinase [Paenibacillus castaneae]
MIKSLYVRMLCYFLGSVLVSLMIGFFITERLYKDRLIELVQNNLISSGKTIIEAYKESAPDNRDVLIRGMSSMALYSIRLYDHTGRFIPEASSKSEDTAPISNEKLQSVLTGGVYHGNQGKGFKHFGVGLPFAIDGESYALFISLNLESFGRMLGGLFRTQLLIVLLFGSFLIILSVRYIVRPIQHLTKATHKMARGNFSIHLSTKRKDEIGQLTTSFNQMAHELGMLEKIRRQFVSDVSHEIQSPLTSIKGFTQALKNKKMDEASRMRLLNIIEEESNRLSRLSEDLLQLSSLEYDHLQLNVHSFRLDEQIRNVLISLEPQWSSKHIEIEIELKEIFVRADEDKLVQVWANLIGNSIKFTNDYGKIQVTGKENAEGIEIAITDNGLGIGEAEIHNIFKPFYKEDQSRDRSISGNGIGLSIVKRIIDLHQGDIQVISQQGEGSTFTVFFPH